MKNLLPYTLLAICVALSLCLDAQLTSDLTPSTKSSINIDRQATTISEEVWQADLSVSMEQRNSGYQIYDISVTCENDDDCRSAKLVFTLPLESRVNAVKFEPQFSATAYSIQGNASQSSASPTTDIDGYILVDFPNLSKGTTKLSISIEFLDKSRSKSDGASVTVFSNTPELKKQNNFFYLPLNR